jgi:hypothetical protein
MEGDQFGRPDQENAGDRDIMSSSTTQVFLGDLAMALKRAGAPGGENWLQIFSLLGLGRAAEIAPRSQDEPTAVTTQQVDQTVERRSTDGIRSPLGSGGNQDIGELIEFDFERTTAPAHSLPPAPAPAPEPRRATPLLQPLLDPLWERGILIEAVGTPVAEGDIALLEAVERIARGEPLRDIPRDMVQSVSKGCQVLIDAGAGMRPFARDTRQLADAVRKAVGAYHTRVLTFVDSPLRGVLTETYDDETYAPPENGALVLAVSDLCRGGPRSAIRQAEPADWLKLARIVRDAGSALVVLNPYPCERWPAQVTERVPVVYWDRSTRAADVRRTRRRTRR